MSRMNVVKASKFEKLSMTEMQAVKGGLCISCMKRARKVPIDFRFADKKKTNLSALELIAEEPEHVDNFDVS